MLRREHHLLADPLLLLFTAGEVQPAAWREIAFDSLTQNELLEQIPIAKRETQDKGGLPFAFRLHHLQRQPRITAAKKRQSFSGQPFIDADGVLGDQLEVSAVASTRLSRRIALIDHDHFGVVA